MKRLLLGVIAVLCSTLAYSQATEIVVETYAEDIGMVNMVDLTGYNTYRLYVKFSSQEDYLAAVYGDADFPTRIQGGNNFFNSSLGGLTNANYNPLLFAGFPDLEFDSFVTIGMAQPADPGANEGVVNTIGDPLEDWSLAFEPGLGSTGSDLIINTQTGGSWFPLFPDTNAYAGEDSLILIGQFTTDTTLFGVVSIATFVDGVQENDTLVTLPFSSVPNAVFGCTDMNALNFDMDANEDDGSCVFACDYPLTALVISGVATNGVSCAGFADGNVSVEVTGGQGGLSFTNGVATNATGLFANVAAGATTITVSDAQGCTIDTVLTVSSPDPLVVTASLSDPISCNGESDAVLSGSATGGTGMISYSLMSPMIDSTGAPFFENPMDMLLFEGVGSGLYTVYALDENGCADNTPGIQVSEPLAFNLYAQATAPTTCPDSEDGTVVLNFFGGSGSGTTYSLDGELFSTENTFSLAPGLYTFYAQDVNGCPDTLMDVEVTTPPAFESLVELVSPTCFGGTNGAITVEVQGGTAPLQYVFEGDTAANVLLTMVGGGDYPIEVVDSNGCSFDAGVSLSEPDAVVPTVDVTNVLCFGDENGAMTVTAAGGTGMGYVYDLAGGGFGPNAQFDGLAAGTYTVTVQDDAECSGSVEVTVATPDALDITVDANEGATGEETDGEIDITVLGGTAPYSFDWTGDGFTSDEEDIVGVGAGEYTVTISDANGCEFTSTTIVVVSGIEEVVSLIDLTLFPNPTAGAFEVQLSGLSGESVTATLVDGLGREVVRKDLGNLSGQFTKRFDLSAYESGVYHLRMEIGSTVEVLRVVKR